MLIGKGNGPATNGSYTSSLCQRCLLLNCLYFCLISYELSFVSVLLLPELPLIICQTCKNTAMNAKVCKHINLCLFAALTHWQLEHSFSKTTSKPHDICGWYPVVSTFIARTSIAINLKGANFLKLSSFGAVESINVGELRAIGKWHQGGG